MRVVALLTLSRVLCVLSSVHSYIIYPMREEGWRLPVYSLVYYRGRGCRGGGEGGIGVPYLSHDVIVLIYT